MRFMIQVRATATSEAGEFPDDLSVFAEMAKYHEELAAAGVLLDASGLKPSSAGWRVGYDDGGKRVLRDGPFAEAKELIAGYTLIQTRTREEAMEWTRRFPSPFPGQACEIEVRQLYEMEDFPAPVAEMFPEQTPHKS